jgi:hypothetical protein
MNSWFQAFAFKCNLYRYTSEGYHIVLEFANEGTLNDRIVEWREKRREWDEGEVLEIFCQLCLAMGGAVQVVEIQLT